MILRQKSAANEKLTTAAPDTTSNNILIRPENLSEILKTHEMLWT